MQHVVIFDYDGVVADSMDDIIKIWNQESKLFGNGTMVSKEFVKSQPTGAWRIFYKDTLGIPASKIEESGKHFYEMQSQQNLPPLFDGMLEVIQQLATAYPLYILSSNNSDRIRLGIEKSGLKELIRDIAGNEEVGKYNKNDPQFILAALQRWGVKPSDAVYIGDTADEIIGSRLAGIKSISCSWGYQSVESLQQANPDALVRNPSELLDAINKVFLITNN